MKKPSLWVLVMLAAVLVAACQNQRAPAEQAVAAAESALTNIRDMATRYAPDQLQAVDAQLNSAKDSLAKGDYKAVLAGMPALQSAINSLKDTTTAKQQEVDAANAKAKDAWGPMRYRAASTSSRSRITCRRASPRTHSPRRSRAWTA